MGEVWGVLFCVCLGLLASSSTAKGIAPVKRAAEEKANEDARDAILYGFLPDKKSPNFVGRGNKIFEFSAADKDKYVKKAVDKQVYRKTRYSDSENTVAKKAALDMSVSGHYGAFSGSASMKVSSSSSSQIKTVRYDLLVKAMEYKVSSDDAFRTYPERFLTQEFQDSVKSLSCEDIATRIGIFYATEFRLGGELMKSYTMQATSKDSETSVSAEVEAAYDGGAMGVSVSAKVGVSTRSSNKNSNMKVSWAAQGGDTTIWLGKSFSKGKDKDSQDEELKAIAEEWANSFTEANMYPSDLKLRPMWDLIKEVDQAKGEEFESYLRGVWDKAAAEFKPTIFLEPETDGKIGTAWAWASNFYSSYGSHESQKNNLLSPEYSRRLHTQCESDGEWIGITFDQACWVQKVKIVNGKTDKYKWRIDGSNIWVREDNDEQYCGTVTVKDDSTFYGQTYEIECRDKDPKAFKNMGIYGVGATIYNKKNTCTELAFMEAHGICGRAGPK